jgi:PIN domain
MSRIVLYDACVLYSASIRDLLVRLALSDLFQARWTDEIHDEWIRNVLANRPDISPASLLRCRQLMDAHVPDCLISGYEAIIPTLTLPDADDRHVLAAAIHAGATFIVTFNLSDFPAPVLAEFNVEAIHPDSFISGLCNEHIDAVAEAARLQRAGLKNPPKSPAEYLATLKESNLPKTAACLRRYAHEI